MSMGISDDHVINEEWRDLKFRTFKIVRAEVSMSEYYNLDHL